MWTTLNIKVPLILKVRWKWKGRAGYYKSTLSIEFEQDWSVGLGAILADGQKIKNYFSSFRNFPGNADSVILLGFECTITPQNLIKIVRAIFEKIRNLIFFLMWTTLIGVGGKLKKKARDIYKRTLDIEFEWDRSIGLGSMMGDGQSDRQTDTHRHFFLKHIFRLWEWCRIKNHKKIEVYFFDDCNSSFPRKVARK